MKYDILLIGVGGEGTLTSQVIIARAANLEGYYVRGVQLHGLAQRGGSAPTEVRFGDKTEVFSPTIMQGNADLVIAFEPLEAVRATFWASRDKTNFIINDDPYPTIYSHLLKMQYPEIEEIKERVGVFAKEIYALNATKIAIKKFKKPVLANTILLGLAKGFNLLPIKEENLKKAIEISAPRETENNLKAFEAGIEYAKEID